MEPNLDKTRPKDTLSEWITAAIVLAMFFWILKGCPGCPGLPEATSSREVRLRTDSGGPVWLAVTEEAWDRLTQLSDAGDEMGVRQLFASGLAWSVPSGTRARVIDPGIMCVEVRITEGGQSGRSGFTAAEFARQ